MQAIRRNRGGVLVRGCAAALVIGCLAAFTAPALAATGLEQALLAAQKLLGKAAQTHGASAALRQLYGQGEARLLWSQAGEPTVQARALITELTEAETYGLSSSDYAVAELAKLRDAPASAPETQWARFDVELSAAALRFVSDLHFGRVSPEAAGFQLQEPRESYDLGAAVTRIAGGSDVVGAIAAAEPGFFHYKLLKQALAHYREIAQHGQLPTLPPVSRSVMPGGTYAGAAALAEVLGRLGDLPPGGAHAAGDTTFDATLSEGVRHFQDRHGLAADGVLGKSTIAALNTPLDKRMRQITLTLERWRWLLPFKTPPIIVNIPQFRLFAFRTTEDRVADILQMDVIVGRTFAHTQTPVFEGDMRYVVLRPYWDVPPSITRRELLPKIRANPGYLNSQRLQIVAGPGDNSEVVAPTAANLEALEAGKMRLRQLPGEDNALGLAKFIFPNNYNVYLHSTPAHRLFQESVRAFSHGCIRVADPLALATLVLKDADGDWTREKIEAAMNGTRDNLRINLKQPINVLILYGTALATEAGPVLFFEDIYGYDRKLEKQLGLTAAR